MRLDIIGKVCKDCRGSGEIVYKIFPAGVLQPVSVCPTCKGVGRVSVDGPKWSKELPTVAGYYWHSGFEGKMLIEVRDPEPTWGPGVYWVFGWDQPSRFSDTPDAMYCGPITPPEVPV